MLVLTCSGGHTQPRQLTTTAKCSYSRSSPPAAPVPPPCCVYRRDHSRFWLMCSSGLKYGAVLPRSRCSSTGQPAGKAW